MKFKDTLANTRVVDLLDEARQKGISIFLKDDQLKLKVAKNKQVDQDFLNVLRTYREEIISFLKSEATDFKKIDLKEQAIPVFDRNAIDKIPLSFAQQRLWFIDQLENSVHYHIPEVLRFKGTLDIDLLEKAFRKVIDRHESLRSCFIDDDGTPYQRIQSSQEWKLSRATVIEEEAEAAIDEIKDQPFDLSKDYMLRAGLLSISEDEHLLVLVLHHIAADGWSLSILVDELTEIYSAWGQGKTPALNEMSIQYADYAVWQQSESNSKAYEEKLAYWEQKLANTTQLDLYTDYTRPAIQSTRGKYHSFQLKGDLHQEIQNLCKEQEVTLFMLLLAVYNILLSRFSGKNDICVGTPVANRLSEETERLIGYFINTLAIRNQLDKDQSFESLLQKVKTSTMEAFSCQDVPFEKIVEKVQKGRDRSRTPLFESMLVLQNIPDAPSIETEGLQLSTEPVESETAKFDLTFLIAESSTTLEIDIEYCTDLFKPTTIELFEKQFCLLLEAVTNNPATKIGKLPYMDAADKKEICTNFNATESPLPEVQSVLDLFEQQLIKTPAATAVSSSEKTLTYQELEVQSSQMANLLQAKGVKPGDIVALCLNRSVDTIVAILGTIKAGAAYLPIDVAYPVERIRYILEDAGANLVLSHSTSCPDFLKEESALTLLLTDEIQLDKYSALKPALPNQLEELIYIIYTSGSTGKPKGVMIEHQNLLNYLSFSKKHYGENIGALNFPLFTSLSFDLTQTSIFLPLITGGELVVESANDIAVALENIFANPQINAIKLTPSHVELIEEEANQAMKVAIVGGEKLEKHHYQKLRTLSPELKVYNEYGPTEATIGCTVQLVDNADQTSHIGQPIDNTQIYILDEEQQVLGAGIYGELYIGGNGLARGYINRPELTEQKFVNISLDGNPVQRLYRTGDLARWLPDGRLEFRGRKDDQFKLRGYRIEPGEIENTLEKYPAVKRAAAVLKAKASGEKYLAAYLTTEEQIETAELRGFLKSHLPDYMVPSAIVLIDEIPLTANGKLDTSSLPEPDQQPNLSGEYVAARNQLEEELVALWKTIIEAEQIGVYDDFFEMGGHSLSATRLASAIRKQLNANLEVQDIFTYSTVAAQAQFISTTEQDAPIAEVTRQKRPEHIPLSFSQERIWFIDQMEGSRHYHMPMLVKLNGDLDLPALEQAFQGIINRHEPLRTIFYQHEDGVYQTCIPAENWKIEKLDFTSTDDPTALEALIDTEIEKPFDISFDYPIRAAIVPMTEDEQMLILNIHHIASDGWSEAIFINELVEGYTAAIEDRSPQWAELPIQYADYSIWQRTHLQGDRFDKKLAYWENQLADLDPLELPLDFPRPKERSTEGAAHSFSVDKETKDALLQMANEQGVSLFMILISLYKILLYRYTGQTDICVGTPTANRTQKELEPLIGLFLNTIALRSDLSSNPSFIDFLSSEKKTLLDAFKHQDIPFEKIVEKVETIRDLSRTPVFQTLFVLQNTPQARSVEMEGLQLSFVPPAGVAAKFELSLHVNETEAGLDMEFSYGSQLFKEETIQRMAQHFKNLIQSALRYPAKQLSGLRILDPKERVYLIKKVNTSSVILPKGKTIVDLFEEQVAKTPDVIAVRYLEASYTFKEFNISANQFAHYLRKKGFKTNDRIAICMTSPLDALIAIFAILKSGGAYVPIDPQLPEERIRYMLEDTRCRLMITDLDGISVAEKFNSPVIVFENGSEAFSNESGDNLSLERSVDDHLYIIYTSGSTGKPKGVLISQLNMVDYLYGFYRKVDLRNCKNFGLMSTMTADLGNTVLYSSLLTGGTLHLFSKDHLVDPAFLHNYFDRNHIDFIKLVPSHWSALSMDEKALMPDRIILFGGEELTTKQWNIIQSSGKKIQVFNHYGPTETTIGKLIYPVRNVADGEPIPIGQPFSNSRIYIVHPDFSLCPVGVSGQLLIGGIGVSAGYYNHPELTEERFKSDPFCKLETTKVYLTGDRVRMRPDGNVVFEGRIDDQVKIRGYRIEPGEVSKVLQQCEGVKQCVVVTRKNPQEEFQLVAYIVPEGKMNQEQLKLSLAEVLPEHMIPALFQELSAIPLNANGKVDRKKLPPPEWTTAQQSIYQAPQSETELKLEEIWKTLLNINLIGVHDNFFEMGGHSLLAIRMVSAIRKVFKVEIQVKEIFLQPTIEKLASLLEQAKQGKALSRIAPQTRTKEIPLSYSQERIWFIDQLGGSTQYHMPSVLRLKGALNTKAIEYAFQQIVNRHEVLRTVYRDREGIAFQEILKQDKWVLNQYAELRETGFRTEEDFIADFVGRPFDLAQHYPIRAAVLQNGAAEFILIIVVHHIASDGWSTPILTRELIENYTAYTENRQASLNPLLVQYADFSIWQRKHLGQAALGKQLDYWEQQLKGNLSLNLPLDFPRPAIQSHKGKVLSYRVDPKVLRALKVLANKQEGTLFMVLLAAFKVLLYRYTGQEDICVGTHVANRSTAEIEPLIGFFLNTLAIRTKPNEQQDFSGFFNELKHTILEAYSHQDVPFEKIVDRVEDERDMSRSSLFQVLFTLQNMGETPDLQLPGIEIAEADSQSDFSKFDLTCNAVLGEKELVFQFEYCTDLFLESTIQRMFEHFEELLKAICQNPKEKLNQLNMMSAEEEGSILLDFNDTAITFPENEAKPLNGSANRELVENQGTTIVELFIKQALATPHATAIEFEGSQMTYQELDRQSTRLANYLSSQGVQPESLIGICLNRSFEMMIGLLGILKAGGAYVPIDPQYPKERIDYILEDTQTNWVLVNNSERPLFEADEDLNVIVLNEAGSRWKEASDEKVLPLPTATQLMYVIYTSGSTGRPKGVMNQYDGVVNRLLWTQAHFNLLPEEDTILQKTTYCFDVSVWELFWPVIKGIRMVLARPEGHKDNIYLKSVIEKEKVTTLHFVPSMLEVFLLDIQAGDCPDLRRVICSGEALTPHQVALFKERLGHVALHNLYGPTEAAIDVTYWDVPMGDQAITSVPIGKPVANTQLYILDKIGNPVPVGIAGELYIGGIQVARGYLNRPELTKERFIQHPFNRNKEEKLYKTGDLARWLPDGNIEYLGRMDTQVKIRGFRIELGEIESVLSAAPFIRQCVVIASDDKQGRKRLVAYIVPAEAVEYKAIIQYLQDRLPDYMVPQLIVKLEEIPLTPNGKANRKALPDPTSQAIEEGEQEMPRNEMEQQLVKIWEELLGVSGIGIRNNFFRLGGDSIITIQFVSKARKAGYFFQARDLFLHQTIAQLADNYDNLRAKNSSEQGALTGEVPLLPIQHWFFEENTNGNHHFNQSALLKINKEVSDEHLEETVKALVQRHDALRLSFQNTKAGWTQRYTNQEGKLLIKFIEEDLPLTENKNEIPKICDHFQKSLNIEKGELYRVVRIKTQETDQYDRLFICIHHLAIDGVSWRVLLDDMGTAMKALAEGKTIDFGTKGNSYREWSNSLQTYSESAAMQSQLDYWTAIAKEDYALPTDFESSSLLVKNQKELMETIDAETTSNLLTQAGTAYNTQINDLLLTALALSLKEWSDQPKVVLGMEGHGREDLFDTMDISQTLGWFTSLFPVCIDAGEKDLGGNIKSIKEQLRAIPDKGLGYGVLRYLHPDQKVRASLAEASWEMTFNYLGVLDNIISSNNLFEEASESTGNNISTETTASAKIGLNAFVSDGQFHLVWTYAEELYKEETIAKLASQFKQQLEEIANHCLAQETTVYTPADYGLSGKIKIEELDAFLNDGKREDVESIYPMSPMQEGLLFHSLYGDSTTAYTEQYHFDLPEGLVVDAFEESWNHLLRQFSILRSSFIYEDFSIPLQCVHKQVKIPFTVLDFTTLTEELKTKKVEYLLKKDLEEGFDFSAAPLMRVILVKMDEVAYKVVWTHHHILMDGWSIPILIETLMATYERILKGQKPAEVEEDRYEDHIRLIEEKDQYEEQNFWKNYLDGFQEPSLLPFIGNVKDRNRSSAGTGESSIEFDRKFSGALKEFAQTHHLTINTLLQGVWALLLSRYVGKEEVSFGVTVSGRSPELKNWESRVGLYINTLPLRTRVADDMKLTNWLSALQEDHTATREYGHSALRQIQKWCEIEGDLFDSIFIFENYPSGKVFEQERGLKIDNLSVHEQTNYLLTISATMADTLAMTFRYNDTLLSDEYIADIQGHFQEVLRQIVELKKETLGELDLLTKEETEKILYQFNPPKLQSRFSDRVEQLFDEQAAKTPDSIALVDGERTISYGQLAQQSNELANYICQTYKGTDQLIPLCMDRCADMVIAMLAILKSGNAYVPIDPAYPVQRISFILKDIDARLLLTKEKYLAAVSAETEIEVLCMDSEWAKVAAAPKRKPLTSLTIDNLAYVIYTSGSTGQPKGVLIKQQTLLNLIDWHLDVCKLEPDNRATQLAGIGFDVSVWEIWPYLIWGGALHILQDDYRLSPENLINYYQEHQITHSFVPTILVPEVVEASRGKELNLQYMLTGGDALAPVDVKGLSYGLINIYGPTENTVVTTFYELTEEDAYRNPLIGMGIKNVQVYILDKRGKPVPVGVAGELYTGGGNLAVGYLNRPELSTEKFIEHTLPNGESERMYMTGDLVRWNRDGQIEFIGRIDNQIQIKGYRVELGEIEAALQASSEVYQAVVIAKKKGQTVTQLLAYVLTNEGYSKDRLMAHLYDSLPKYMVPAIVIELEKFPMTPNGKIDRRALPSPDFSAALSTDYVAPVNEVERDLEKIWKELLNVEQVGRYDNFFELGGDSIITIQVVSRAKRLGYHFLPKHLFNHQTIAALALVIEEYSSIAEAEQGRLIGEAGMGPIQQWFFENEFEGMSLFNQAALLKIDKGLAPEKLNAAVVALTEQHDALRFKYVKGASGWQQFYTEKTTGIEFVDLSHLPPAQQSEAITEACEASQGSLNLEEGILMKALLLKTHSEDPFNRLFITIHHLVVDGVSWRILLDQLEESLHQLDMGQAISLGQKTNSFREWTKKLTELSNSKRITDQQPYWQSVLEGVKPLPVDKKYGITLMKDARDLSVKLDNKATEDLLKNVNQAYHTEINDILISALAKTINEWSNHHKMAFGLEGHGRDSIDEQMDVSNTVGWFTSIYPVAIATKDQMNTTELIKSVKEQLRMIPDKGIGYGLLKYLHSSGEVREQFDQSKWEIVFNYLGQFDNLTQSSSWFEAAEEAMGDSISDFYPFGARLKINSSIQDGQLSLVWSYSPHDYEEETINQLAKNYIANLIQIINHCKDQKDRTFTPSDLGLNGKVSYQELDELFEVDDAEGDEILKF